MCGIGSRVFSNLLLSLWCLFYGSCMPERGGSKGPLIGPEGQGLTHPLHPNNPAT